MRVHSRRGAWVVRGTSTLLLGGLLLALTGSMAWASSDCTSDHRARPTFGGNPKSCRELGFSGDTLLGSNSDHGAGDPALGGTVTDNVGPVQPGYGQEVDLSTKGIPGVVVDAVVVGGAGWYNTYRDPADLLPDRGSKQHYIPPLDGGHQVSWVSYWFACYHCDPPSVLAEAPLALEAPLAGGAIFAAYVVVQRRRRKAASVS
jgi:hypothetical protein